MKQIKQISVDLVDPELYKAKIKQGKLNHFICYLPLPNGKEKIELGDFILDGKEYPDGEDVLTSFDKDDLDDLVEALEDEAPNSTPEEFWRAYDCCRVLPNELIWVLLTPEVAIYLFDQRAKMREMWEENK